MASMQDPEIHYGWAVKLYNPPVCSNRNLIETQIFENWPCRDGVYKLCPDLSILQLEAKRLYSIDRSFSPPCDFLLLHCSQHLAFRTRSQKFTLSFLLIWHADGPRRSYVSSGGGVEGLFRGGRSLVYAWQAAALLGLAGGHVERLSVSTAV
jgi:hypothetical protein